MGLNSLIIPSVKGWLIKQEQHKIMSGMAKNPISETSFTQQKELLIEIYARSNEKIRKKEILGKLFFAAYVARNES